MSRRWVVKIGSALLTADGRGLDVSSISSWVEQMIALREAGIEVILVSSGAVAEGMSRLSMPTRPQSLHELQAIAAVGQMGLVQAYESEFQKYKLATAQVLLTHDDLSNRKRYLNARSTLLTLLNLGVVPVVNENDTVVTDEIRFGDNDTLAALVANLVEAEQLVILTDKDGLYDADPGSNPDANLVKEALATDEKLEEIAGASSSGLGRGGMITKVSAARLAARSGARTVIAGGRNQDVLKKILDGSVECTVLLPEKGAMAARKQWLAGHLQMRGELVLDEGAVSVLKKAGSSLLPVGVKDVKGSFIRGDMVACVSPQGEKIACGLVNYDAVDAKKIAGKRSEDIESVLGYLDEEELIHRDNLVLL